MSHPVSLSSAARRTLVFAGLFSLTVPSACTQQVADPEAVQTVATDDSDLSQALTQAEREHTLETIRRLAAARGITNALPIAGIASAESNLRQCYDGLSWHCRGPSSGYCPGGVTAGGSDGACEEQQGGLGLMQHDQGTYADTIAVRGSEILNLEGNIDAGITFILNMIQTSPQGPRLPSEEAAIAYLNQVEIDSPRWHPWLRMVTATYNGCDWWPDWPCNLRYDEYDTHARFVRDLTGDGFWAATVPGGGEDIDDTLSARWSIPLERNGWLKGFNVQNPDLSAFWAGCFGRPLSEAIHAGEDWKVDAQTQVHAVGEGEVISSQFMNYPGWVIVIRHQLTEPERQALGLTTSTVYSQYGHVTAPEVQVGDWVQAGDVIATIHNQDANANTHLHWEMRTVAVPQLCGFTHAGPGYTDWGTDARAFGYLHPSQTLATLSAVDASISGARCDNDVAVGETACNADVADVEYVCARPNASSTEQWDARACPSGTRCQGNRCLPPCDNGVWMGETACAAQGQTVEFVCEDPASESPWRARTCPPLHTCQGDRCVQQ